MANMQQNKQQNKQQNNQMTEEMRVLGTHAAGATDLFQTRTTSTMQQIDPEEGHGVTGETRTEQKQNKGNSGITSG